MSDTDAETAMVEPNLSPLSDPKVNQSGVTDVVSGDPAVLDFPGTGAADIRAIAERRYEAFRNRDWDTYLESCRPGSREATTFGDLENIYTASFPRITSAADLRLEVGNITLLSPIDAIVELHIYEFDELLPSALLPWQNVDGNWYSAACSEST